MKDSQMIVGLDIGTTKITTVIGELAADGSIDIIGQGSVPSAGLKRGAVVNVEQAVNAIKGSVHKAERVAGVSVENMYVSVGGSYVKAITSHGLAAIRRGNEITAADVERAIDNAQAVPLDPNLEVLHTLPQEFEVDGQSGIRSPIGMQGVRLEVDVHIVAGTAGPLLNLRRCVQEAGYNVSGFVLKSLASGLSTVTYTEQSQSVMVVDMGGGSTDIALFRRGYLAHSASIPIGGDHVTADLAQILRIPMEEAEDVKRRYGAALPTMADADLTLEITTAQGKTHAVGAQDLAKVIRPRIAEIFGLIRDELDQTVGPLEKEVQQVILTGGASGLTGSKELARDRFRLPVRLGKPVNVGGLVDIVNAPEFASAVGLVLYGIRRDGRLLPPTQPQPQQMPEPMMAPQPQQQGGKPLLKRREADQQRETMQPNGPMVVQRSAGGQQPQRPAQGKGQQQPRRGPQAQVQAGGPVRVREVSQGGPVRVQPQSGEVLRDEGAKKEGEGKGIFAKIRSFFSDWM